MWEQCDKCNRIIAYVGCWRHCLCNAGDYDRLLGIIRQHAPDLYDKIDRKYSPPPEVPDVESE